MCDSKVEPQRAGYDHDYFINGKKSGKSLYENYRWMPGLTVPMAKAIVDHMEIKGGETILDFGCARGYLVKALRQLGYSSFGRDVSEWAITNSDFDVREFLSLGDTLTREYDWVIAKDVLEHVTHVDEVIDDLQIHTAKGLFVVVPLSNSDGEPYVVPEYELDVTHIHRLSLETWAKKFRKKGWTVDASYYIKGIKDNWSHYDQGNGFIVVKREVL